jgi:hypothetical protein
MQKHNPAAWKTKYLAKFKCRIKNVVISQYKPYSDTLQKHIKKHTTSKRLTVKYEPMNT